MQQNAAFCSSGRKIKMEQSAPSLFSLSASVTLGGHMVGCGPDPQRGCIPGTAIGNVRAEMPNPLLPQFPHTAVSPAWKQQFRQSYVTGVGCEVKGGLEGGIMDWWRGKTRGGCFRLSIETKLSTVTCPKLVYNQSLPTKCHHAGFILRG